MLALHAGTPVCSGRGAVQMSVSAAAFGTGADSCPSVQSECKKDPCYDYHHEKNKDGTAADRDTVHGMVPF
jgi:hypothetical protein